MVHELRDCGLPGYDRLGKEDQGRKAEVEEFQQGRAQAEEDCGLRCLLEEYYLGGLNWQNLR